MGLKDELTEEVSKIFSSLWTETDAQVVPESDSISFANVAKKLPDAVVLYADLSSSTKLVDEKSWKFAAEVYKTFLHCAAKIIRSEAGAITAYDGDRIMAVYVGNSKNSSAARTALKINWARINIINALLKKQYPATDYEVRHVVGIDSGALYAVKTGVRGDNDLVWVGKAANHAAKLSALSVGGSSWITGEVYDRLIDDVKATKGNPMWERHIWNEMNGRIIYKSTWTWGVN
jgi:class 3 adenylate cyclase